MEKIKQEIAEKWGYENWDTLWNMFHDSKESTEIIEEVSWALSNRETSKLLEQNRELIEALNGLKELPSLLICSADTLEIHASNRNSYSTYAPKLNKFSEKLQALLTKIENNHP